MAEINSLQKRIDTYVDRHPELKLASQEQIISIMFESNMLTQAEVDMLKNSSLFAFNADNIDDFAQIMGFEKQTQYPIQNNSVEKPIYTHKETSAILLDETGKIDESQFTLEGLKQRYTEKDYKIEEIVEEYEGIQSTTYKITNKKTNENIAEYYISDYSIHIDTQNESIALNKDSSFFSFLSNDENKIKLSSINKYKANGYETEFIVFGNSGDIEKSSIYERINNNNVLVEETLYSNGEPYKTIRDGETIKNRIIEDLIAIFNNKDWLGNLKNPKKIYTIYKDINPKNVYEILNDYKNKTGRDLLDDISNADTRDKKGLAKIRLLTEYFNPSRILNKIREYMQNNIYAEKNSDINYIAQRLAENINNSDYKTLLEDLKLISVDTTSTFASCSISEGVLNKFKELNPSGKDLFTELLDTDKLTNEEKANIIPSILFGMKIITDKKTYDLILAILNDNKFMTLLFENCDKYCEDIKADMILNKNNPEKLLIDLRRFVDRGENQENKLISRPNGKIDVDFEQGNTGDCWLLAGLIAICEKDECKKALESLIKVDKKTGNVTVTLKGVKKTYTITEEEIRNSNHLSGGDGDVRALELAYDKYIQEKAYHEDSFEYDINGNSCSYMFEIIFGKSELIKGYNKNDEQWDFNNPNKFYCIGTSWLDVKDTKVVENIVIKENGEFENFVVGHAYALIKSDEEYVYLVNPWDSSETLKMTHENLEKIKPSIGYRQNK